MKQAACLTLALMFCATVCHGGAIVKLDTEKPQEPISKYIYGQFIEHLGKCIYGGLWAEMLEDRKFLFPVTDEYNPWRTREDRTWASGPFQVLGGSPWRTLGQPGQVKMETEQPYVGRHSVAITIPGSGAETGISHEGLSVIQTKKYVGRIVLAAQGEVTPVRVQLTLPEGQVVVHSIDKLTADYAAYPFELTSPATTDQAKLEIISTAAGGTLYIGAVSLMPADNVKGFRPDVIAVLKELDSPIYRWPGGNFVSAYNWRDAINPNRDKRAPGGNPAWGGIELNDVGIHEFMELMELIGSEPFIALNMGRGSVEDAAAEVEYIVGGPETPMGKLRAQNGRAEPWKVTYWAVGNEMYGRWQAGFMPQPQYIQKQNQAADAIWKIDPKAQLIAVGQVGRWTQNMFINSADKMNLLSEHIYCKLNANTIVHAQALRTEIRRVTSAHRGYREQIEQLKGKDIRLAMDEWNYWYGPYIFGELGVRYRHKDGLGVALGLHEFFRNSDLYFMANYAQTVNVLGAIKTTPTAAAFETTGLALMMYRKHFGETPIGIAEQPSGEVDVSAAWTADKSAITVAVVNITDQPQPITLDTGGKVNFAPSAKRWMIANADMEAFNDPGKPPAVSIREDAVTITGNNLEVPPQSAVIYRLEKQ